MYGKINFIYEIIVCKSYLFIKKGQKRKNGVSPGKQLHTTALKAGKSTSYI